MYFFYRVTHWYASTDFERYSYYGEVGNPSGLMVHLMEKLLDVSFWIKKSFGMNF